MGNTQTTFFHLPLPNIMLGQQCGGHSQASSAVPLELKAICVALKDEIAAEAGHKNEDFETFDVVSFTTQVSSMYAHLVAL